jgi:CheY-like chemotaxis protein
MISYLCETGLRQVTQSLVALYRPTPDATGPLIDALRLIAQDATQLARPDIKRAAEQAEDAARELLLGAADGHATCVRGLMELGQVLLLALGAEAAHPVEKAEGLVRRLLVVDDSRVAAVALSRAFTLQGFLVRSVATMVDALAELTIFQPSVLVSDVHMPDLDVGVLSRVFRALSRGRSSLVVLVSGTTGVELDTRLAEVKPDGFVAKTSGTKPVVECVMRLWEKRQGASPAAPGE